jgi:hypothetical protein
MSKLEDLKQKIANGVKRHYNTPEGTVHRKKLSIAMKKKWKQLKGDEDGE